jgi:hypothetical protein
MNLTLDNSHVPRCQHVKADGIQCNNPALKQQRFCYYHAQVERTRRKPTGSPQIVGVDTLAAIRIALGDLLNRIARGAIDHRDARLMLRGLQTATVLLKHGSRSPLPRDVRIVTDARALSPFVNPGADGDGIGEHPDGTPSLQERICAALEQLRQRKAFEAGVASVTAPNAAGPPESSPSQEDAASAPAQESNDPSNACETTSTASPSSSSSCEPTDCEPTGFEPTEAEIVEALSAEVKRNLPARAPGQPATCLLLHNTYCDFAPLDESIWTCPIHQSFEDKVPYVVPDLHPFLKDVDQAERCEMLANLATEFHHLQIPLGSGVRNPDHSLANS